MIAYGDQLAKTEGAIFDPAGDKWRALPPSGLPFAARGLVVWAGDRLFIYSGDEKTGQGAEGSSLRSNPSSVWTGREAIVWGGCCSEKGPFADGAIYRP